MCIKQIFGIKSSFVARSSHLDLYGQMEIQGLFSLAVTPHQIETLDAQSQLDKQQPNEHKTQDPGYRIHPGLDPELCSFDIRLQLCRDRIILLSAHCRV
jgi:hypothetical protein